MGSSFAGGFGFQVLALVLRSVYNGDSRLGGRTKGPYL